MPVIVSPKNLAAAVRSFPAVGRQLAKGRLDKLKAGRNFEEQVGLVWKQLQKNTKCFVDGVAVRGTPKGCRIPDFFLNGRQLIEVKTTVGAVKKRQFQEFLRISQANGTPLTIITRSKPTAAELGKLQRYADEVLESGDDIYLKILHIAD